MNTSINNINKKSYSMSKGMAIEIYNSILQLNGNIVLKNNNKVRFEEKEKI